MATGQIKRLVRDRGFGFIRPEGASEDIAEAASPTRPARLRTGEDPGVVVKGVDDVWVKLARCCTPVPGDEITGFVTRGAGVSVHRTDCVNVPGLQALLLTQVPCTRSVRQVDVRCTYAVAIRRPDSAT